MERPYVETDLCGMAIGFYLQDERLKDQSIKSIHIDILYRSLGVAVTVTVASFVSLTTSVAIVTVPARLDLFISVSPYKSLCLGLRV